MAYTNSSKFAKKFCAKSPFKSGMGDIKAQEDFQEGLEPLLGDKRVTDGNVAYRTKEEFDADVDKEFQDVKGTEDEAGFTTWQKHRKHILSKPASTTPIKNYKKGYYGE